MKVIFITIIFVVFFTGLLKYRQIESKAIRRFVPFLAYTFVVELLAHLQLVSINGRNHWWYNIFTVTEFLFIGFIFYHELNSKHLKSAIKVGLCLFLFISIFNIAFIQGWNEFHTITYRCGSLLVILLCFFYFRQLLQSENKHHPFLIPMFWICTGLLFFYIGFFFYINIFDFIAYSKLKEYGALFRFISNFLNILLYSFIGIGIIQSWRIRT
jgi:hypothetical protein